MGRKIKVCTCRVSDSTFTPHVYFLQLGRDGSTNAYCLERKLGGDHRVGEAQGDPGEACTSSN